MERELEHRLIAAELNLLASLAEDIASDYSVDDGKNVRAYLVAQAGRLRDAAKENIKRAEDARTKTGFYDHLKESN